jgi:hypothetical protein
MSNVKAVKLLTGEEIIAEILEENSSIVKIQNPLALIAQRGQQGPTLGLMPWMPYLKGELKLSQSAIVLVEEVDEELKNEYNRIFGTGLLVPSKQLITG